MVNLSSTLGIQLINSANLQNGQTYLSKLTQQLSTGHVSDNLSDFTAGQAQNILNLSNGISQQNAFSSVITTLTPRINIYDTSLSGIEDTAAQAKTVTVGSNTYNPDQNQSNAIQFQGFMNQVSYFLNQQVNGRYVFSGTRYGTPPVTDLTKLGIPTQAEIAAITGNVSSQTVPNYDVEASPPASASIEEGSMILSSKYSGTFGNGVTLTLSAGSTTGIKATLSAPGQPNEVYDNISGTGTTFWNTLATSINSSSRLATAEAGTYAIDPTIGNSYTLSGGAGSAKNNYATTTIGTSDITFDALSTGTAGNNISVSISNVVGTTADVTITDGTTTETYNGISGVGAAFWSNLANAVNSAPSSLVMATAGGGTNAPTVSSYTLSGATTTSNSAAYYEDTVPLSTAQNITYGISSNAKGFQELILGLRFAYAATQNVTNYKSYMAQGASLITQGLTDIRGIHSGLSSDNATLQSAKDTQATATTALKNQLGDLQNVDINDVAVKIQAFQTQLQASYSATATMTKLTILNYL